MELGWDQRDNKIITASVRNKREDTAEMEYLRDKGRKDFLLLKMDHYTIEQWTLDIAKCNILYFEIHKIHTKKRTIIPETWFVLFTAYIM